MVTVQLRSQATRTETFAGVTAKLNGPLSLYAQDGYQFAMEQTFYGIRRDGAQGDIGLRYNW
jgi:outer membrane autotransporter protein